ncbi:putative tape measure domain protein [Riemerella phage RAP44]|uniref:tail length tape measure protein n=1 Tax=Riemerella phage RAP44 TaxID=936152 RepID=UPI0002078585|nr:tail length tape measure protein [Riemerella phage RAP44]AEB71691.1 putative tape measure domain protein [Riemerella phage RAP44]WGH49506.1 tape measure domain protein [Riemerella phage vB_RanS_CRP2]
MNTNNGGLFFGAAIDMTQWRKDLREIQADILGLNQKTQEQTRQMDTSFKNLSIGIAGYFSGQALMGFTRQLINVRGEFQKAEIAFSTMLKSKEKANELMGQMVDLAAKTPFGLNDVTEGAKRLLAFQVPAEQVTETLTRMGNIAAGLGVPMGQLIHVYGQVKAQGKIMTNDLYQFMNAGIPILSELGKVLGKSEAEIKDMVSAGKIGFPEVQAVIKNMTDEGGLFFNIMEEQSKVLSGQVSNLEDAFERMLNKIGEGNEGILYSGIEGATYLVEHYEDVIDVLTILVATYGSYRAALIVTSVLQKAQIAQQAISNWLSLAKSIRTAKDAQALFNLTTSANPIGAIIALIGLLATTYVTYGDEIKKLIGITNEYDEINKELSETLSEIDQKGTEEISTLGKLYKVATDDKKSREERLAATKRLQNEYPSYFGNLSAEIIMAGKAANAYNSLREAIIASAKARAIRSKIEEIEKERLEGEAELINKKEEILKKYRKGKKEGWKDETVNYGRDEFGKSNIVTFRGEDNKKALASQFVDVNKRLKEYQKETEKQTQVFADMTEEQERISAKYNADRQKREEEEAKKQQTSLSNTANETKKKAKAHQKALAEVYSKNSIKDLEERISLWNNALERATKDKDGNYQVKVRGKDKYGKEYETGQVVSKDKALEELKVLNEAKAKIEEEFRIKSTEEELAELKRRINLRDKYLQIGMNRPELINEDTVNNLFPDLKDKSYVQVLEEKRKAYLGLIEAQKATEQTTIDLIFIENELKNANGTETFMQGVNDRISELKEKYKGAELIDKLKKAKSLQLGGTEEDNLERNKAYASALKEAQKDYDKFYRDLLEQQKTYEEKSLELQKEYTALKATERYKNATPEEQKKIDKHYKKEQSKLDMDAFKESGDWALAFSDLEYMSQSTIERVIKNFEDFKRAKEQNLEPTELRELNDTLNKLRAKAGNNPFTGIISGVKGYVQANKDAKTAQDEYNATVDKFGKNSPQAQEAYRKMTDAEQEAIKAKQLLNAQLQKGQDIFNATIQGVTELADAFGGMDDATKDAIEDITAVGNAAFDLAKSISSGNIAGMISAGLKLIGSIFKALNGDKRREREVRRQEQAIRKLKDAYDELSHALDKAFGSQKQKGQRELIQNLRQQQQAIQNAKNAESQKKKKDQGKIDEYNAQYKATERAIKDLEESIIKDVLQTDIPEMAAKIGDVLEDSFLRGKDGLKDLDKAFNNMLRGIARHQLDLFLQDEMKGFYEKARSYAGFDEKGNGSFDGFQDWEIESLKSMWQSISENGRKFLEGMSNVYEGFQELEDPDSLAGAMRGMSEETAGILAGQFNAIRIHVAEIQKNQGFGLDIAKSSLLNLMKIEENTRNLYQMRKDLAEMNAKIKSNDTRGLGL